MSAVGSIGNSLKRAYSGSDDDHKSVKKMKQDKIPHSSVLFKKSSNDEVKEEIGSSLFKATTASSTTSIAKIYSKKETKSFLNEIVKNKFKNKNRDEVKFIINKYISKGVNINARNSSDSDALCIIVCSQEPDMQLFKVLLDLMSDKAINRIGDGWTAFHFAVLTGNTEIVKILLPKISNELINAPTTLGASVLHSAARSNYIEIAKMFLSRISTSTFSCVDELNKSPLHYAAEVGNFDIIKLLLPYVPYEILITSDNKGKTVLSYVNKYNARRERKGLLVDNSVAILITEAIESAQKIQIENKDNQKESTHDEN